MDNSNDFLKDWLEGKITPDELKAKKEKGDVVVRDFDELITRSAQLEVPEKITKEEAWKNLTAKLAQAPKQEARVIKLRWIPLSIAASVTFLVVAFFAFNKMSVSTQIAETKLHTLPDGSTVTLNASSKITTSRFGWLGDRTVLLEGEAFFNVTKGNTFTVETDAGSISVLGTSFNIKSRVSDFEVSCFTGKVSVKSGEKEVILTKGLATKLEGTALADAEGFDLQQGTWRSGDFYFESRPLSEVIEELERQFNVEIMFEGDPSRLYTGYFSNKNLDEAFTMVFKPMSLNYQRTNDNQILVK